MARKDRPIRVDLERDEHLAVIASSLPNSEPALFAYGREAMLRYDEAVCNDEPDAAELARAEYRAVVWKLNGGSNFASYGDLTSPGERLRDYCRAADGLPFRWGQGGAFIVELDGLRAVLVSKGGFCLGGSAAWHVIDLDKPFFSETGFLSYLGAQTLWGGTLEQAAVFWLRSIVSGERSLKKLPHDAFARTHPKDWSHLEHAAVAAASRQATPSSQPYTPFPF